jgi:hypothetical protein
MERWVPLLGYPGYSISNLGQVRNDKRYHVLTVYENQNRRPFVKISRDGMQLTRNVAKLVCESFLPQPANPSFTTPIHFDGNLTNCTVDNLAWRPRWFALDHTEQFRRDLPDYPDPVRELRTEEIFENSWAAVLRYGLLYMELIKAIRFKTYIFPTMQMYEWA